jgi:hypothetical protein
MMSQRACDEISVGIEVDYCSYEVFWVIGARRSPT